MTSQEAIRAQEQLGYVYAKGGAPFKTPAAVKRGLKAEGLNPDNYEIIEVKNDEEEVVGYAAQPARRKEERYWWVMFQAKSSPQDPDQVNLSVDGEVVLCQRQKEVPLPERFLECADHATYPQSRIVPNRPRKIVAWVTLFPYTKIRQATREDFEEYLASGTRKTLDDLEKYGYESEVD